MTALAEVVRGEGEVEEPQAPQQIRKVYSSALVTRSRLPPVQRSQPPRSPSASEPVAVALMVSMVDINIGD
eukprot:jgi/Ulvmu1/5763/UM025_0017.1